MLWSRYFLVRNTNGGDGSGRNAREDGKNTQSRLDGGPFNEQIRQSVSQSVSVFGQLSFHHPWTGSERCSRYPYSVKNLKDKIEKSEGDNNKPPSYLTVCKTNRPGSNQTRGRMQGGITEFQIGFNELEVRNQRKTIPPHANQSYHRDSARILPTKYLLIYYVPLERFLFSSPLKDGWLKRTAPPTML